MFNNVPIKGHVKWFICIPVIFQSTLLIMPQLHNNYQKQTYFLNRHIRQWALFFVQCVQLVATVSVGLFHQQLYHFKHNSIKRLNWVVFSNLSFLFVNSLGSLVNLWTTGTQCVLSAHCVQFVSNVIYVTSVSVSRWEEMPSSSNKCISVKF
jgi:hypothetical protein